MRSLAIVRGLTTAALAFGLTASGLAAAEPTPAEGAEYVSLGDSFISVGSYLTTSMNSDCAQASDDVGHLVAAQMPGVGFTDLACGGIPANLVEKSATGLSVATRYISISTGVQQRRLLYGAATELLTTGIVNCAPQFRQESEAKLDRLGASLDSAYAAADQES